MKVILSAFKIKKAIAPTEIKYATTIAECCQMAKEYIKKYQIPRIWWEGAMVYVYDKFVGTIAYNGTFVDDKNNRTKCTQPKLRSKFYM